MMAQEKAKASSKAYVVSILSDNVSTDAITDNLFHLTFIGDKGESEKNDIKFECAEADTRTYNIKDNVTIQKHKFTIVSKDVGALTSIRVHHKNADNGVYRWYFGHIKVNYGKDDKGNPKKLTFRFYQWIDQYSGMLTLEIAAKPKLIVDDWSMKFDGDGIRDSMTMGGLRSIRNQKKNTEEGSEARKVLDRAEEILNSDDFQEKKEVSRQYLLKTGLLDRFFDERLEEMAIDIAERESERMTDMMEFERAGQPLEEQAKIRKFDETNNVCYAYLRKHGNMWQYDPKDFHPKYKARVYRRFDTFDKNHDGFLTIDEILLWADRIKQICDTDDYEVENVRNALDCYFTMYGMRNPGGVCRENWVEAHCTMGEAAKQREKNGEPIPMKFLAKSYFDIIDEDDNGVVELRELKNMMNVFRVPEEAAYTFVEFADKDCNGVLEETEMHKLFWNFWFEPYDEKLDGIFAYKY